MVNKLFKGCCIAAVFGTFVGIGIAIVDKAIALADNDSLGDIPDYDFTNSPMRPSQFKTFDLKKDIEAEKAEENKGAAPASEGHYFWDDKDPQKVAQADGE